MSSKREKYLHLKHDLLTSCGQCIGFRARGVDLEKAGEKPACGPSVDCHKSCPALGLGGPATPQGGKPSVIQRKESPAQDQTCHRCGKSGSGAVLIPCRHQGRSLWVCTRCLPALIHG